MMESVGNAVRIANTLLEKIAMVSILKIFKIGIMPSSLHTVCMIKADKIVSQSIIAFFIYIVVDVYGSLLLTGKRHHNIIIIIDLAETCQTA
ncbi:MAG: serine dehydratase beta chain [Candidatus Malihini olakiniferum]